MLKIRAESAYEQSTVARILTLVETAAEEGYIAAEWKDRILAFRDNPSDESWIK